jgi:hypothetical protein
MKIAYMIAAHKNPKWIVRLVDRLDDEDISFFIHINQKEEQVYQATREMLAGRENIYFTPRVPIRWADFGLVRCILEGIQSIRESGMQFDYFINMSGQDYPIKPNDVIKQRLAEYDGRTILDSFRLQHNRDWDGQEGPARFERHYIWILGKPRNFPPAKMHWIPHKKREVPHGLAPYGGSAWWCFNPEALEYINDFIQTEVGKDVIRFYEHTWGAAEMFFHTVLMNSPLADDIVNEDLWQIDWQKGSSRPSLYTAEHFDKLRDSDRLFARKFDPEVDTEIFDLIDEKLLHVEKQP